MAGLLFALFLLFGAGASAQTAHFAWEQRVVATGTSAAQVAADKYGNLWVAMPGGTVKEILAVGGSIPPSPGIRSWTASLSTPTGVAVDSNGNVFVANSGSGTVIEMAAVSGVVPHMPAIRVLHTFSAPDVPTALAVDSSGNVYVASSDAVYELEAVSGVIPASPTVLALPNPANAAPLGVAVDGAGNVYVADNFNSTVYEVPFGYVDASSIVTLGGGFSSPTGVAVDAQGNIYAADNGNSAVKEMPSSCASSACVTPLGSGFSNPAGVGVDLNGNAYVGDTGNAEIQELALRAVNFGGKHVGSAGTTYTLTFIFDTGGSIGAPVVLTMGATGQDFSDAATGTCTSNGTSHVYSPGDSCTVNATFRPRHPGTRVGAALLEDNSGNVLATVHLEGWGIGPQINFLPGTQSALGGGFSFSGPSGVALDGAGNIYVADTVNNAVEEITQASGYTTVNALGGGFGFSGPSGVAVDGAGNLFVADTGNSAVEELTFAGGYATVLTLGGGFSFSGPSGVVVDGAGNLYVADTGNGAVEELAFAGGYSTVTALGSSFSFSGPSGVAVDGAGNLYVADTGNGAVEELTFASGYTTVTALGGSFSSPSGVALDGIGDIFVAASGNTVVSEIPLGCAGSSCVLSLGSGFSALAGVAVDGGGNVYVADTGNNAIEEMDLADALSLTFASTGVSATSTDSPQTVTVSNDGNATLTLSGLSIPADFPLAGSGGSVCTSTTALISGASCTLPIDFTPTGLGSPLSESLVLTDNNLNGTAVTESLLLSGTAVQGTPTVTIGNLPASGIYGLGFTAVVSYTGDGTPSIASSTLSVCTVSGSAVSYVGVGACTLTASATAGTNYIAVTGNAQSFPIGQATPAIHIGNIPSSAIYGGAFSPAIVYTGDGTASVVSNSTTICTVVSGSVHFIKVGTCSLTASATETADYTGIAGSAQTFSIGQATPTIAIGNIPSSAAYNGSFTPSITYSGDGVKSVASNSLSICTVVSGVVHYVGVGSCSLTASATAGTDYAAIGGSAQSFSIGQATPTIAINDIPTGAVYGGSFTPAFTYSGNGSPTISVATTTGTICSVSGGVVSFIASGTCSLKASATSTTDYTSVTGSAQSFSIAKVTPTIGISNIPSGALFNGNFTVAYSYNGNGTPSVASNTTAICTVSGNAVSYIGVGTCSLTPSATAGTQSAAVHGSAQTFAIGQATPTLTIDNIPSSAIYGGNFTPEFTYSGNGSPTYSVASSTPGICTVSGGAVSYIHVGSCSLTASATATTDFTGISGSAQSFTIGKATPSISITNIPAVAVNGGSFTPAIGYNGDGAPSVASSTPLTCTVASGVVSYVGVGACDLTASALTGTNYTAIVGSTQNFSINQSAATPPATTSFSAVNVGTASSAVPVTFTFTASSLIGAPVVVTQGANGLDFANAGTGTCDANQYGVNGHVYSATDTCTVKVTFTPRHPGTRVGAVLLEDSLGNLLATAYLEGTGNGPQTNFLPGVETALGGSYVFSGPSGAAVDGAGNLYVADAGNNAVEEFTSASGYGTAAALGGSFTFSGPSGVAVDGSGNIFVADTKNNAVEELTFLSGNATAIALGGGFVFNSPSGVAVDASGNIYVADTNNNAVEELTYLGGYATVTPLGGGFSFSGPSGVAVDGAGNLYVADTGNAAVEELTFASGYTTVNTLGGGFTNPTGLAVDGIGDLFVADTANTAVSEIPAGCASSMCVSTLGSAFSALAGVAVDGSGNVFVADTGNNAVKKIDLADVPSLSFAQTGVGATSTDSPRTVTVANDGNASLNLSGLSIPTDFSLALGGTNCTAASQVASGATCTLPIDFTPTELGSPLSESLVLTDNNLNGTAVTQSLSLSGTAVQGTPAITITNLPASGIYGLGFTATISYSGDGTVSLTSNSTGVCTVSGNAVSYVGVGTCSLTASATEGTNYIAAPGTAQTFSIGQATPSIAISNIPSGALYSGSFTPQYTNTGDGTPSVASNSTDVCTVSGGVVSYIHVGTCSLTASALAGTNYTAITGSAQTFSVGQASTTIAIGNIPSGALYDGSFTPTYTYAGDGTPSVASNSTSVCTVSGGLVSYIHVGTCSLTASATTGTNFTASNGSLQSFSVDQATPTITIGNLPASGIHGGGFTATISYSGDGTVSLASNSTSVCAAAGNAVSYVGVGTCSLTASAAAGTNYVAAPGSAQTIPIGQATPSIAIDNIPSGALYNGSFIPAYTYNGDGTPSVASNSTGVCTVSGGVVSYIHVGTCSLTASALAGTDFTSIAGSAQTFTISQAPQVITFVAATPVVYGVSPIALNATSASSGVNPITYVLGSSTTASAALSGDNNSTLTIDGPGTISVKASQAGSTNYTAAASVWQTIVVDPAPQTISFPALSPVTYGASPIALGATSTTSGTNAIVYAIVSGSSYASLSGSVLTITGAGRVVVSASQAAGGNYAAARTVYQTLTVNQVSQTLVFTSAATATYRSSVALTTTSGASGNPVIYSVVSGPGTVAGSTLTFTGTGMVKVAADQEGNANYAAAAEATQNITVGAATPAITWAPPSPIVYGTSLSGVLNAYANAGGSFAYTLASSSGTPVTAGTVLGAGTYTIFANFTPTSSADYNSASASVSLEVNAATPAISIGNIPSNAVYGGGFTPALTTNSDTGTASFVSNTTGNCTVSSGVVSFVSVGNCSLTASVTAGANYARATGSAQIFSIAPAAQTIGFSVSSPVTYGVSPIALGATSATSGTNPIVYAIVSGSSYASLSGGVLTITGAGKVVVSASEAAGGNYAAAKTVYQTLVVNQISQTIVFTSASTATYRSSLTLTTVNGASGNPVIYSVVSGPGTISGNTLTFTGTGTVRVAADQEGNANYAAAAEVTQNIAVGAATPTITWAPPSPIVYGRTLSGILNAHANAGGSFAYTLASSAGTPVTAGTVLSAGSYNVFANFTPTSATDYNSASTSVSLEVNAATPAISIGNIPSNAVFGGSFTPALTTNSDTGTASFVSNTTGNCTVSSGVVSFVAAGHCSLTASVTAGTNYASATGSAQIFTIAPAAQTISFPNSLSVTYGVSPVTLSATSATSGTNPIVYAILSGSSYASLSGSVLTITGAGKVVVSASQAAENNYAAAKTVYQTITINQISQTLVFTSASTATYRSSLTLTTTSGASGNPVIYSVVSGPGTISGSTLSFSGAGTVEVAADQEGNANYAAAAEATQTILVGAATPTITWAPPSPIVYGTALSGILNAYANAAGTFTYTTGSASGTSVNGGTTLSVGSYTIYASFTPTSAVNYNSTSASVSLLVNAATPALAFAVIPAQTYSLGGTVQATASSASSGAITYSVASGPATVNSTSGLTKLTGAGLVTITAVQAANGNYAAVTAPASIAFTVNPATPALAFTAIPAQTYRVGGTVAASVTWVSTGAITYSVAGGPASVNSTTGVVTLLGAGTVSLLATQSASGPYTAGTATTSFLVNPATPPLTFATVPAKTYGAAPFSVSATSASSGEVTFVVTSGPATVSGSTVTINGAGTVELTATQAASSPYATATATTSFLVNPEVPVLAFAAIPAETYGNAAFMVHAASASSGAVTYSASGAATVNSTSGLVTLTGAGSVTITATQAASGNYAGATATTTLTVATQAPKLTFVAIPVQTYGNAAFTVSATSTSTGAVTYAASGAATVNSTTGLVTLTGAGSVTITATQAASGNYAGATATATFTVATETPTLTFAAIAAETYGNAAFAVSATSTSTGSVTYKVSSGPATINSSTGLVTLTGAGSVTLQATQAASGNYAGATAATSFTVAAETPALTFAAVPAKTYGAAPFSVSATSASSGEVTYLVSSGPATVSGSTVTIIGAGAVELTATQAASSPYGTATATTSFTINPAAPALTFAAIPAETYGNAAFKVSAASASSGAVTYTASGAATVNSTSGLVTLTGAGLVTITATQAASGNYSGATAVTSFTVATETPALAFSAIAAETYGNAAFTVSATSASSGAVTYKVSSGPATVNSSTGLLTLTGAGSVTLLATQAASGNYAGATATATFTVARATPAVKLTASAASAKSGVSIVFTATLTGSSVTPGGTVTFYDGTTQLGTGTLNSGVATYTTTRLAIGAHGIVVSYGGDVNYISASSDAAVVVVTAD
jgi:sugar lactone lactonase YvrE